MPRVVKIATVELAMSRNRMICSTWFRARSDGDTRRHARAIPAIAMQSTTTADEAAAVRFSSR